MVCGDTNKTEDKVKENITTSPSVAVQMAKLRTMSSYLSPRV